MSNDGHPTRGQAVQKADAPKGQSVAVLSPARIPMPAAAATEFNLTESSWRALTDAVFPLAKTADGIMLALAYCKSRDLDIFRKAIHLVTMKVNTPSGEKEIETVWPGIGEQRITAQRQADFFGYDECEFGEVIPFKGLAKIEKWKNGRREGWETVNWDGHVPEWAQFTVYKRIHGQRIALKGPRVFFIETYTPVGRYNPAPNDRWTRAPRQMLEKCAEAAALRRAWPDVFGDEHTFEEMDGKTLGDPMIGHNGPPAEVETIDIVPAKKPQRSDYVEVKGVTVDVGDDEELEQAVAEVEAKAKAGEAQPEQADDPFLDGTATRGQWETWADNLRDRAENFKSVSALDVAFDAQAARLAAAPEDLREQICSTFAAERQAFG